MDSPGSNVSPRSLAPAIALVFVLAMLCGWVSYLFVGEPTPILHDEFSNLLEADTFAHGRLANPPHPMAEFFEAFHVIQHPTYASKFPPGLPVLLAIGEFVWRPILGAWLSVAAGSAAVCWMLGAWFARREALLGGVLVATMPATHVWLTSYWGGGVAMLGGALAGGATIRLLHRPSRLLGTVAAAGAFLLFNSRPFEGALLCTLLGILVLRQLPRQRPLRRALFARAMPSALIAFAGLLSLNLIYNHRVTGSYFQLPYALHAAQYMRAPLMFWQRPHEPTVDAPEPIRSFHRAQEWDEYVQQKSLRGFAKRLYEKVHVMFIGYGYPYVLLGALLCSLAAWSRSQAVRWCWTIGMALPLIHFAATPWLRWTYFAPLMGFYVALILTGLSVIGRWKFRGGRVGRTVVLALIAAHFALSGWLEWRLDQRSPPPIIALRQQILSTFSRLGGQHLVFVTFDPARDKAIDIVYNPADVDSAQVVFARDLGAQENRELLRYYPQRHAWIIDPASAGPRPYAEGE